MAADQYTLAPRPVRSAASIAALICAIGSFIQSGRGHPIWAIIVAFVGIFCGAAGLLRSLSPHVKGGFLSIVAIGLSAMAVVYAIITAIAHHV
jgi:hypothetical protein